MMTNTQPTESPSPRRPDVSPPGADVIEIQTRFGVVRFGQDDILDLPNGLVGLPDYHRFGLSAIPDPRMGQFHLLQSLEDLQLSFLVLPIQLGEATIAEADALDACAALAVPAEDARFYLIVTLRKAETGLSVSVNLRAPLILDSKSKVARQFVLANPDYPVRKML